MHDCPMIIFDIVHLLHCNERYFTHLFILHQKINAQKRVA